MGYPLILKGAVGSGGQTVHLVRHPDGLRSALAASPPTRGWLVQEYVGGPVGSTSFAARNGTIYGYCSSYKHMSLDGGLGPSSIRRFVAHDELERLTRRIAAAGRISGITGYDWMEPEPGVFQAIDPHLGRTTSSAPASSFDGVDLGRAFHASLTGGDPEPPPRGSGRIVWMMPQSIQLLFEAGPATVLRRANPIRRDVSVFWCGEGEGRMFRHIALDYLRGQLGVLLGRWRRKLLGGGAKG